MNQPFGASEPGDVNPVSTGERRTVGGLVGYLVALGGLLALLATPGLVAGLAVGAGAATVGHRVWSQVRRRSRSPTSRSQSPRVPTPSGSESRPSKE